MISAFNKLSFVIFFKCSNTVNLLLFLSYVIFIYNVRGKIGVFYHWTGNVLGMFQLIPLFSEYIEVLAEFILKYSSLLLTSR